MMTPTNPNRDAIQQLESLNDATVRPPADDVSLAVADALLPNPLPMALRSFLRVCDGARVGELELFGVERITDATNAGAHAWYLPETTLIVGAAGVGRSLVMIGDRDEVCEVDDDPWDSRTIHVAADTPLELFTRYRGLPLRSRDRWWALPGAADAIKEAHAGLQRDTAALLEVGLASRTDKELPSSLTGFTTVEASLIRPLLASPEFSMQLVNHRPPSPFPGVSAAAHWPKACAAIADIGLRDAVRATPLPARLTAVGLLPDRERTAADAVRELAALALVAAARDRLAALLRGEGSIDDSSHSRRLVRVLLAGHVPLGFSSAI